MNKRDSYLEVIHDLQNRGASKGETDYAYEVLKEHDPDCIDPKYAPKGGLVNQTLENLTPKDMPDLIRMVFKEFLDPKNVDTLGPAELEEFFKELFKDNGSVKGAVGLTFNDIIEAAQRKGVLLGAEKTGKTLPSPDYWGPSSIYGRLCEREAMLTIELKDTKDIRQQLFKYPPQNKQVDDDLVKKFDKVEKEVFEPIDKLIFATKDAYMTLTDPNVDDKWGETLSKWMEIGADKYLAFGNHGSGEIHSVLTGKYVMRLGKKQITDEDTGEVIKTIDAVVTVPIKREFTREQVADKVLFKPNGHIDCPACKERFKLPDFDMDLIAGDLFDRAHKALLVNPLTQFLDAMTNDIVLVKQFKSPQQFYREQCALYRKKVTEEEIANVANIEVKPEKIKLETLQKMEFNMKYGNADRRHNMAEHFSDQS